MSVLRSRKCPTCKAKNALHIFPHSMLVSCSSCHKIIRSLSKREKIKFNRQFSKLKKELSELRKGGGNVG